MTDSPVVLALRKLPDPSAQEVAILPGSVLTPASALHEVAGLSVQIILEVRPEVTSAPVISDEDLVPLIESARTRGRHGAAARAIRTVSRRVVARRAWPISPTTWGRTRMRPGDVQREVAP